MWSSVIVSALESQTQKSTTSRVRLRRFSCIHIMISTKGPLFFFVLLFFGLEEATASQRGRCVRSEKKNLCTFEVLTDFEGAKEHCKRSNEALLSSSSEEDVKKMTRLLGRSSGRYWLHNTDKTKLQSCTAVSVTRGGNVTLLSEPCREKIDGFVCQYGADDFCSRVPAHRGAEMMYITHTGFEVVDSETFPPGTIVTIGKVGGKYPDSKHLCYSQTWSSAPWNCEVLNGGCEHNCNRTRNFCACPVGQSIHHNKFSCMVDQCSACEQECELEGGRYVCKCKGGYRLALDGKRCVDVDECAEKLDTCAGEGEECVNMPGKYECRCADGFDREDGVCVNVTICSYCEHMDCQKIEGVYQCVCKEGFRVSPKDPTKCEQHCSTTICPARCVPNVELEKKDMQQCFCPNGFIVEIRNKTGFCHDVNECEQQKMCDHRCENLFGGYRCLCNEGFRLTDEEKCVEEDESGSTPAHLTPASTPASSLPASLPSYIKTGSVLGITVFLLLCVVLLACMARHVSKRCRKLEFCTIKHPDIFYLQQVTTETYKRLSFDKQSKNNSQIL
ncbi:thrombomodulin-like [Menidia menidia]